MTIIKHGNTQLDGNIYLQPWRQGLDHQIIVMTIIKQGNTQLIVSTNCVKGDFPRIDYSLVQSIQFNSNSNFNSISNRTFKPNSMHTYNHDTISRITTLRTTQTYYQTNHPITKTQELHKQQHPTKRVIFINNYLD